MRLATMDNYDQFFASPDWQASPVSREQALEESFFLGLRLNRGVDLERLRHEFGDMVSRYDGEIAELGVHGLLKREGQQVCLTSQGKLLSNEVFQSFIAAGDPAARPS